MPARLNRKHSEEVRAKIQAAVLIERLHRCAAGDLMLTKEQLKATELLLDRSVPKLSQIQHTGDPDNPVAVQRIELVALDGNGSGSNT